MKHRADYWVGKSDDFSMNRLGDFKVRFTLLFWVKFKGYSSPCIWCDFREKWVFREITSG